MPPDPQARLRAICLALPGAHEVLTHGEPTFRIRDKQFAVFASAGNHHGNGRPAVWLKAGAGNQDVMVALMPDRFFVPPYVGPRGWLGMWLDRRVKWREVAELVGDGYRLVAPKPKVTTPPAPAKGPTRSRSGTVRR